MTSPDLINSLTVPELILQVMKLHEQMVELQAENRRLRAENEELKRNQNRPAAPFSKGKGKTKKRRPGRRPGEGSFAYRGAPGLETITEPVVAVGVGETACPDCGGGLRACGVEWAYRTELPAQPKPQVTAYQIAVCECLACGREVRGRHPEVAATQRGATAHRLGERVLAAAHGLHFQHGVPMRKVPGILRDLTGVVVTQGALAQDARRRTEGEVGRAYAALRERVGQAARVHTDDTGWRVAGQGAHLMAFETPSATVYQIRDRHRNEEVRELIASDFPGTLITDRGRSYDAVELARVKQQKCLAHIHRSIAAVLETKYGPARRFGTRLKHLLTQALDLWHAYHRGEVADLPARAAPIVAQVTTHLADRQLPDADNQRLLNEIGRHHDAGNLLRFLQDPTLEPTNNRAERALRPAVIARKVSHCSQNQTGARIFEAFKSVTQTFKQTGHSVIDGLYDLFRAAKPQPHSL